MMASLLIVPRRTHPRRPLTLGSRIVQRPPSRPPTPRRCFAEIDLIISLPLAGIETFTPVWAKHSRSFSLIDYISVGVDRMQRNFEPMRKQVEAWQRSELTDVTAEVVIYDVFVKLVA